METLDARKILFVITKSNWGGAQAYVYTLAKRFKEAGADVVVALGGSGGIGAPSGLLRARLEDAGVRTIFISSFARDMGLVREMAALFELLQIIRKERPDVLHLNSSKAGGIGALAGRIAHIRKIIFTVHGWAHSESRPWYERWIILFASWFTAQLAHKIIVVSKFDLIHAPVLFSRRKLLLIYNGITPFSLLSREQAREELTAKIAGTARTLGDVEASFWFFSIAELHPNKGLDILIRSFASIVGKHKDAVLVIVGDGEQWSGLNTLARSLNLENRVFFAGFVENAREYLDAADVFVLPSRKEGLPTVILEAGLARVPVVASRVGAIPEIIEDGVSGLLISPDDVEGLTTALLRIKEDTALRERVRLALHARNVRDFSEETMVKQTAFVYR